MSIIVHRTNDPVLESVFLPKHPLWVYNSALFVTAVIPYDEGRTIEISKDDLEGEFKFPQSACLLFIEESYFIVGEQNPL